MGIAYADAYIGDTINDGFAVNGPPSPLVHAGNALEAAKQHAAGTITLSDADFDQAAHSLTRAASCIPPDDTLLLPELRQLAEGEDVDWIPSKASPIKKRNLLGRLILLLRRRDYHREPERHLVPDPAAEHFPGARAGRCRTSRADPKHRPKCSALA